MKSSERFIRRSARGLIQLLGRMAKASGLESQTLLDEQGGTAGLAVWSSGNEEGLLRGGIKTFEVDGQELRFFFCDELDSIQGLHRKGGLYEPEELAIIRHAYAGGVFVDVGANVGNHSIYAAKFLNAPKVLAFEPLPILAEMLAINVALNGCDFIVEHKRAGLSDAASRADALASSHEHNLGGTRLQISSDGPIELLVGDDVLAGQEVGLIKVDTEGSELNVLAGLKSVIAKCRPVLFIEVDNCNLEAFEGFCASSGYRIAEEFRRYEVCTNFLALPK